jgi:hypothetical protein
MNVETTTRWRRIETLFHQAAEMDPASRNAFVEQACAGDRELRAELDSLLASADLTLTELKGAVADAAGGLLDEERGNLTRIGPYRLIRTLGQGGMGTVFLGRRDDDQYHRTVAIKVLRAGLTHRPELQLQFRTERQILADFDHPSIARMLDGGITSHGSPYLVMEYIDGIALDAWCREHKSNLAARLQLFRTLCTARLITRIATSSSIARRCQRRCSHGIQNRRRFNMSSQFIPPPSTSTRAMSFDRRIAGKLVGHLYIAANTLFKGRLITMEEMRHEVRNIMSNGNKETQSNGLADTHSDATSVAAWNEMVAQMILEMRKIPNASSSLPDRFKKELAVSIRNGMKLCLGGGSASQEARLQLKKATQLYLKLSGVSWL